MESKESIWQQILDYFTRNNWHLNEGMVKDILTKGIDAYLATPSESGMEMARQAVDTMGRKMLALGKEIDTSYGPMQPPEIQKDKAIPYLATLIEDYGRRVPRAMLKELWVSARKEGDARPIKSNQDGEIARIAAKYNVTIEED